MKNGRSKIFLMSIGTDVKRKRANGGAVGIEIKIAGTQVPAIFIYNVRYYFKKRYIFTSL